MSSTSTGTSIRPHETPGSAVEAIRGGHWREVAARALEMAKSGLKMVASLRLTVTLFALSIFLLFAGTLAQVEHGIWTVLHTYFRTAIAWIEPTVFFPGNTAPKWLPAYIPYPGGWLLGGLLLTNLLAAHAVRFKVKARGMRLAAGLVVTGIGIALMILLLMQVHLKISLAFHSFMAELGLTALVTAVVGAGCLLLFFKRAGNVLLHAGIIVLLVSEFITGVYAVEGQMRIREGQAQNYIYHLHQRELAVVNLTSPKGRVVTSVPASRLRTQQVIRHELLPFDIEVLRYMKNSDLIVERTLPGNLGDKVGVEGKNPATAGMGATYVAVKRDEVSGVGEQKINYPSVYVRLRDKRTGEPLGTYLLSLWLSASTKETVQKITVDGETYRMALRLERSYKPYTIKLLDFQNDEYVGTGKAKDYRSVVRLIDPSRNVNRRVEIYMNHPLRYAGQTFYQAAFIPGNMGTVLQVVENPGRLIPYLSCLMVAAGLVAHFGVHLLDFLRRRFKT